MGNSAGDSTDSLEAALGRIPSGLFVLTTGHGSKATAMLVSWVQQCSFDPPQISIALHKDRDALDGLLKGEPFVLNIIPEGGKSLVAHFGKGFEPGEPAFEGIAVRREGEKPPILLASHAYLTCSVVNQADAGDHRLLIARVHSGAVLNEGKPTVHLRKSGLKY